MMKKTTIMEMMNEMIDLKRSMGCERTAETYASALRSFMQFRGHKDCKLIDMTPRLMQQYEAWLKHRGVSRNTSSFYMKRLQAAYNEAVRLGLVAQANPFRLVYTGKEQTAKRAISAGLLRKIKDLDLSGNPRLELARDMFLFSLYTRGMSFVDMAYLKKSDCRKGYLTYRRHKTGQTLKIEWVDCMEEIVKKYDNEESPYLLPIITHDGGDRQQYLKAQRRIGYALHQVAEVAKIKAGLTMYVARHSWATLAQKNGIAVNTIRECLGQDSERTTRIYLASISMGVVDRANRIVLYHFFTGRCSSAR